VSALDHPFQRLASCRAGLSAPTIDQRLRCFGAAERAAATGLLGKSPIPGAVYSFDIARLALVDDG
jgi:hypothetical protein